MSTYPTASGYNDEQKKACESVILELSRILGKYWDDIAIVGGYVPMLLADDPADPHKGTLDVDLALNHLKIPDEDYATIHELLIGNGYIQNTAKAKQFQYFRQIALRGKSYTVAVDLLTGQYDVDTGKNRRHEPVQDVMALKTRGVDLVFSRTVKVTIEGELPNQGGTHSAKCQVAGIVPLTVLKASAIAGRYKSKDAYDLYYTIRHYPGGISAVLEALKPDLNHGLVKEALTLLRQRFASPAQSGPADVANFLELQDDPERAATIRDAYETFLELFEQIDKLVKLKQTSAKIDSKYDTAFKNLADQ